MLENYFNQRTLSWLRPFPIGFRRVVTESDHLRRSNSLSSRHGRSDHVWTDLELIIPRRCKWFILVNVSKLKRVFGNEEKLPFCGNSYNTKVSGFVSFWFQLVLDAFLFKCLEPVWQKRNCLFKCTVSQKIGLNPLIIISSWLLVMKSLSKTIRIGFRAGSFLPIKLLLKPSISQLVHLITASGHLITWTWPLSILHYEIRRPVVTI